MRLLAPRSGARRLSGHLPRGTAPGTLGAFGSAARPGREHRVPRCIPGAHDAKHGEGGRRFRSVSCRQGRRLPPRGGGRRRRAGNHRSGTWLRSARVDPRQILVQRALGLPTPEYAHLPIAVDANERKLSKQNLARRSPSTPPGAVLVDALEFLGQGPPRDLARAPRRRGHLLGESPAGTVHGSRAGALRRRPATPTTRGSAHASSKPLPIRRGQGHAPRRTGSPTDG